VLPTGGGYNDRGGDRGYERPPRDPRDDRGPPGGYGEPAPRSGGGGGDYGRSYDDGERFSRREF